MRANYGAFPVERITLDHSRHLQLHNKVSFIQKVNEEDRLSASSGISCSLPTLNRRGLALFWLVLASWMIVLALVYLLCIAGGTITRCIAASIPTTVSQVDQ